MASQGTRVWNRAWTWGAGRVLTKYRLVVQYRSDGFSGWQVQKDRPTIGGTIEAALARITGETPSVVGAGRTDAGVHALGQVAHFRLRRSLPVDRLLKSLNGVLPSQIRVLRLSLASGAFHAQKDAQRKRYIYRVYNGPILSPFLEGRVRQVYRPLSLEAMQEASALIVGTHDFTGFTASASQVRNRVRTVFVSRWQRKGRHFSYRIEGDGFLHHMVRNLVGTMLQIGLRQRPARDMIMILESRDRRLAGPTAPAHGLFLAQVWYRK